jgi:hypothetical protein
MTPRGIHGDAVPGVHVVAALAHRSGAGLAPAPTESGAGMGLGEVEVAGRVGTGDALVTQRDRCPRIVAGGGTYVLPVDDNQPAPSAAVEAAGSPLARPRPGRAGTAGDGAVAGGRTGPAGGRPR